MYKLINKNNPEKRCFVCGNEINTNIDFHGIKIIKDLNKIVSEKYICFKCID